MAKAAPDAAIDGGLTYIDGATLMTICSDQPTTYAEATTDMMLAEVALASSDIEIANDTSGRSATIAAKSAIPILNSGTATHVAVTLAGDTTLRYVTTCGSQALTAGGTVDTNAWSVNIQDPT